MTRYGLAQEASWWGEPWWRAASTTCQLRSYGRELVIVSKIQKTHHALRILYDVGCCSVNQLGSVLEALVGADKRSKGAMMVEALLGELDIFERECV